MGKSRLVYEFTHSDRTQEWLVLEAGAVSYGKATTYRPVIDLLKVYFEIHDRETHRDILEDAQRLSDRAVDSSRSHSGFAAHELHLLGDIATHPARFDAERGEVHYRQALALAQPRGMRPLVAHCHFGLGKLYLRTAKPKEAQEHLVTARTMYREMGMTYWLERVESEVPRVE